MAQALKDRLLTYLKKRPTEWVASGDLQRLVTKYTDYTPSNASRRLRELEVEGELDVQYRHGHAWYRIHQDASWDWESYNKEVLAMFDEA